MTNASAECLSIGETPFLLFEKMAGFSVEHSRTWERGDMNDLLYQTTIFGPKRTVRFLPWGDELVRPTQIFYHFYNVEQNVNAVPRITKAVERIRKERFWKKEIEAGDAQKIIDALVLGFVPKHDIQNIFQKGDISEILENSLTQGELDSRIPELMSEQVLPWRESPVAGKTLLEIAQNPTAITLFVAVSSEGSPIAIICTPVGIVLTQVALKSGPRFAQWADKKLKEWLK